MNISKDLLLAILSMDSYNRGYGQGIGGLGGLGSKIGAAELTRESDIENDSAGVAAGFYASSYTIGAGVGGRACSPPCKPSEGRHCGLEQPRFY